MRKFITFASHRYPLIARRPKHNRRINHNLRPYVPLDFPTFSPCNPRVALTLTSATAAAWALAGCVRTNAQFSAGAPLSVEAVWRRLGWVSFAATFGAASAAVSWRWVEFNPGAVARIGDNDVRSNIAWIDDEGEPVPKPYAMLYFATLIHLLPWQAAVSARLAEGESQCPLVDEANFFSELSIPNCCA